jgi:hypothetical protein
MRHDFSRASIALSALLVFFFAGALVAADPQTLVIQGGAGPGHGHKIVLVSGDQEYRSEEALPQLAKILAKHHGFDCTVLFAIDPATGAIDPDNEQNIPGLEALDTADLMIIAARHRSLADEQMKHVADFVAAGKPVIGLRTSTHAFKVPADRKYARLGNDSTDGDWEGGFGRRVLGEKWIDHHGKHGHQSTLGMIAPGQADNPILRGIQTGEIWGPTDVYAIRLPLPANCTPLILGESLEGMTRDSKPATGKVNDPMPPVAWSRIRDEGGKQARSFTTTMGSSVDLENEALRRLLVNATYWCLGMEKEIPAKAAVDIVGEYKTLPFKFGGGRKGVKPAELAP